MARRFLPYVVTGTALLFSAGWALAGDAGELVVARVGQTPITAREIERRLASVGPTIKAPSSAEAAKQVLDNLLVPEVRASLEAIQRGLDKGPRFADREREILRQALDDAMKGELVKENAVKPEEIKAYFEANKSRFEQPPRLRLWRILLDDEETAQSVLKEAKAAGSPAKWGELARDKSRDTATNLRQGDLGFVHPDGNTDAPRVRVDAALFRAAEKVKDGELVPEPVKEGSKFAVVWRRGSLPAKSRTLEQERDAIRNLLERQRSERARAELVKRLRGELVREEHPELLEQVPDALFSNRAPRPRPRVSPLRRPGIQKPRPTEQGLR